MALRNFTTQFTKIFEFQRLLYSLFVTFSSVVSIYLLFWRNLIGINYQNFTKPVLAETKTSTSPPSKLAMQYIPYLSRSPKWMFLEVTSSTNSLSLLQTTYAGLINLADYTVVTVLSDFINDESQGVVLISN